MTTADDIKIQFPASALATIFDECDRYDHVETGGRILGTYSESKGVIRLEVSGLIEAGPNASRSPVSFFQDGEYQERVFRTIERDHPKIEHLGNWHTHHMNGLTTLSDGDRATYHRTVNHAKHNIPFFYALLVVAKRRSSDPLERYSVKHFIFRRGDPREFQIPSKYVEIVDAPLVWPLGAVERREEAAAPASVFKPSSHAHAVGQPERVLDRDFLAEFYGGLKPYTSAKLGLYWRGPIELVDGSRPEVVVVEDSTSGSASYSVMLREASAPLKEAVEQLSKQSFSSARGALLFAERSLNRHLFGAGHRAKSRRWF